MKCMYGQRKRALPSDVRAAAIQVAHEIMAQQCEQVVRRSWNEMLVAMHQAGLSPRTIRRVTEKLDTVVLPLCGRPAQPGWRPEKRRQRPARPRWRHLGA